MYDASPHSSPSSAGACAAATPRLEDLLAVSELVVALDTRARVTMACANTCAALGVSPEEIVSRDWVELAVPAAMQEMARRQFLALVAPTAQPLIAPRFAQFEHAIMAGGARRVYRWRATLTTDDAGDVTGVLSHGIDITEQRLAHRRLLQNQNELTQLAALAQAVAREGDGRQAVVDAVQALVGAAAAGLYEPDSEPGTLLVTTAHDPELTGRRVGGEHGPSGALIAFESGEPVFVDEARANPIVDPRVQAQTGIRSLLFQPIVLHDTVVAVLAVGWSEPREQLTDRQAGLVAIAAGEAAAAIDRVAAAHRWEHAAYTDELTGAWNRRAFERAFDASLWEASSSRQPMAVALMDLNGFKQLNDSQGHAAGDAVLRECTALWQAALRPTDTLARLGGDEFAVLLPGCDDSAAEGVALKLRTAIEHAPGCGVGIAIWDGAETTSELLQRADEALYADKARQAAARVRDPQRLAAVEATGLLDAPADPRLTEVTDFVTRLLDVPMSTVTLITDDRQFFAADTGMAARQTPLAEAYCQYPATTGRELAVPDTTRDALLADNPSTTDGGLRAYLGVPIEAGGQIVAVLCALDREQREWTPDQRATMRVAANLARGIITRQG